MLLKKPVTALVAASLLIPLAACQGSGRPKSAEWLPKAAQQLAARGGTPRVNQAHFYVNDHA